MSRETEAAIVAQRYAHIVKYAATKAGAKWRSYIAVKGNSAPFTHEDINQIALEALLLLAGHMPERKHTYAGRLAELEAEGGDRYLQRAVDLYLSAHLAHEVEKVRKDFRGGDTAPESLEARAERLGDASEAKGLETSEETLTGVAARFPLLYAVEVEGQSPKDVMASRGLTSYAYRVAKAVEVEEFAAWARANRRVEDGAEPKGERAILPKTDRKRGVCSYGDPDCTGIHRGRKEDICPSAWEAKLARDRRAFARRTAAQSAT